MEVSAAAALEEGVGGGGAGGGCGWTGLAAQLLVDAVDAKEALPGVGGFGGGVDFEGVGDAGDGYVDGLAVVVAVQGAVCERGGEEVDDGEGEVFFGFLGVCRCL